MRALGADGPEARPWVLIRNKTVLDLNDEARRRGVVVDASLAEARAVLGGDGTISDWEEEPFRAIQSEWLDVCGEFADAVEPLDQHEALIDLSNHPDPICMARRLKATLETKTVLRVALGIGSCRWVARVAADVPGSGDRALLSPAGFVAPLPTSHLPIEPKHRERLVLLGYRTVGEVAELNVETLRKQFGDAAFAVRNVALGSGDALVDSAYPPDCASARFAFDSAPDTLEAFQNGLHALSRSLGAKLLERDAFGEALEVTLEHEDGTTFRLSRRFSKPISSPGSLWPALRIMLSSPPERPVAVVRARLPGLRKSRRVQLGLSGAASKVERDVGADAAIAHVRAAFGDGRIVLGSEMEEPRWRKVRAAWRSANGWAWT